MGIFSKRMNKEGAIAGMLAGIVFTGGYILYFQFLGGTKEQLLFGISSEGIGFVGMLVNFAVAFAVRPFGGEPPKEVRDMVEQIHIPNDAGGASHH
jgi:cation/acetate symporter